MEICEHLIKRVTIIGVGPDEWDQAKTWLVKQGYTEIDSGISHGGFIIGERFLLEGTNPFADLETIYGPMAGE